MWGVHNDTLTTELIDEGFISIGWDELGDLRLIPRGREGLKAALSAAFPERKPHAIAGWAGNLARIRDEMAVGDLVVAPYKPDSTINIGIIVSEYEFAANAQTYQHRRRVEWKKIGIPRTVFTQQALWEIGSFLTVFRVRKHAHEFLAALEAPEDSVDEVTRIVEAVADVHEADDEIDEPRASRIVQHTRDFVLEALQRRINDREFEEFAADVLRTLGYQARVTQFSQDGGVDVIAHRDPLGVEPPLIKVQVKHKTGTVGAPEVQQLIGTQGHGELLLFVTLGSYSRDAVAIERQRSGLRLVSGEDLVSLVLENYRALPELWRVRIPLTPVLVVADAADD